MSTFVSVNFEINTRILQLVNYFGLSNNKFAAEIGISSSRMSNIATSRNKPDSEMLSKIAVKYTNVNMAWILTGKGEMLINSISSNVNEPITSYKTDCTECKEKQRQIEKLQNTIDSLIEANKRDHEIIRELIMKKDDSAK